MQMQSGRGEKGVWGEASAYGAAAAAAAAGGDEGVDLLGMQIGPAPFYANEGRAKHFNVFLSCYSRAKSF